VAAASLGAVSLYGLWAGLGIAPSRFWDLDGSGMDMSEAGHGGGNGSSPDQFRKMAEDYNAKFLQADGSVAIDAASAGHDMAAMDTSANAGHRGHAMPGMNMPETSAPGVAESKASHDDGTAALDVYLLAQKWSFEPAVLRLKANQTYRFRMMAVDVAHGASIQLGNAGHIIRLPKGAVVDRQLTFTRPGEFLLYCTMYCGEGHQFMSGKIIVA
jgi:heme/copper-type cytochrome/quinol oxidase subunit 2